ncbi:MAG TPA: endonuclease [Bacteroidales bacterium]|nr:endonuclease [Bacteroidales bacterium]HPT02045.1 endonuclease [Bacteroidales bacterium]
MKERLFVFILLVFTGNQLFSQIPEGYYNTASGLYGTNLQQALHDIIDNHTSVTYSSLWTYFQDTDKKPDGKVWDMYSDVPGGTPAYEYTFITDQCGNYNSEGDCYNKEHSFPASWFNDGYPMYSDMFHLVPTDGYVNNKRSNYPFGEVGTASWTSTNGSKLGNCVSTGYSGTVFEPIDAYKGDFARNLFYMATRYYKEDTGWPGSDMVSGSQPKPWAIAMLLEWHQADPVSQKEIDRNNAIYAIQHNRNPFIDHPEYAANIWSPNALAEEGVKAQHLITIFPTPSSGRCYFDLPEGSESKDIALCVHSASGTSVTPAFAINNTTVTVNLDNMAAGMYVLVLINNQTGRHYIGKILVH